MNVIDQHKEVPCCEVEGGKYLKVKIIIIKTSEKCGMHLISHPYTPIHPKNNSVQILAFRSHLIIQRKSISG